MKIPLAEMRFLSMGQTRAVTVPAGKPRPGAKAAKPPHRAGKVYIAKCRETLDDGSVKNHRLEVTCLGVEPDGEAWRVRLIKWDRTDHVRLLKARPGTSDYTERDALALPDEPEGVDAATLKRFATAAEEHGRLGSQYRVDHETRKQRDELSRMVDELSARRDIGEAAAKRLARIRRELARLEREMRAA